MKVYAILLAIICANNSYARDICDKWFDKLKISNSDSCLLKCTSAKVSMATFHCTSRCAHLCNTKFKTKALFTIQNIAYYPGTTMQERALIAKYPKAAIKVYLAKNKAENMTKKTFGISITGDESDAFRHFVWACFLTIEIGEVRAMEFLNAHEQDDKQKPELKAMDLANNRFGVFRAKQLIKEKKISDEDIKEAALEALKNKNIVYLKGDKKK